MREPTFLILTAHAAELRHDADAAELRRDADAAATRLRLAFGGAR